MEKSGVKYGSVRETASNRNNLLRPFYELVHQRSNQLHSPHMKLIVRFKELQVCDPANPDVSRTAEAWVMDGVYRVSDAEAPAGSDAADMTGTDNKKRKRGDERPAEGSGKSPTEVLRHQSDDSDIHHTAGKLEMACLAEDTVAAGAGMPAAQPSEDVVTADETAGMQSSALYTSGILDDPAAPLHSQHLKDPGRA
eukprot:jgi/Ulvmu1/84/UM001_0087.1